VVIFPYDAYAKVTNCAFFAWYTTLPVFTCSFANEKGKVADKMKIAYKYSLYQVGQFADMAEKMETAYFGTFFIAKHR
jgi:hypothetical protein